jgi:5-aminolevulinate synthase
LRLPSSKSNALPGDAPDAVRRSPRGPKDQGHDRNSVPDGNGADGTCKIAGTNSPLVELVHELADPHGKAAAFVFTSGYVFKPVRDPDHRKACSLSDALNRNSIIDRQSGVNRKICRHHDVADVERLLAAEPRTAEADRLRRPYSVDGDVAPIGRIQNAAAP